MENDNDADNEEGDPARGASQNVAIGAGEVKAPNAETILAMEELTKGKGKRFKDSEALFKDLGI